MNTLQDIHWLHALLLFAASAGFCAAYVRYHHWKRRARRLQDDVDHYRKAHTDEAKRSAIYAAAGAKLASLITDHEELHELKLAADRIRWNAVEEVLAVSDAEVQEGSQAERLYKILMELKDGLEKDRQTAEEPP